MDKNSIKSTSNLKILVYIFISLALPVTLFILGSRLDIRNRAQDLNTKPYYPPAYPSPIISQAPGTPPTAIPTRIPTSTPAASTDSTGSLRKGSGQATTPNPTIIPSTPISIPTGEKIADLNHDNKVDVLDLSILLSSWNTRNPIADINQDGTVNIFDLSVLLSN